MKKYTLLVYKNSNQFTIINFDTAAEADAQVKDLTNIYKIKLFELNENKDGKNLLKEYIINNINDLLHEPGTKVLSYEIITDFTHSIQFRINYKITQEVQTANELWYNKRFLDLRLIQS